jgi:MSHA biogenesis protein MshK
MLLLLTCHLQADELADPTRPSGASAAPASKVASSGQLKLEGIVHSAQREIAIINGRVLKVGEWIGDARIDAIARNRVRYTRGGRSQVLMLDTPIKVKRSSAVREDKQ